MVTAMEMKVDYVKTKDGAVLEYPYDPERLRLDHPNTSFPSELSQELLAEWGVFAVEDHGCPPLDPITHTCVMGVPELDGEKWVHVGTLVPASAEEIDQRIADRAANVRAERDRKLAATDWMALSDVTLSAEMATYRQALRDITSQEGFPHSVVWPTKPQ
jgi:transglutaminase-like putative cysteine protease